MKVKRVVKVDVRSFQVGDIISFKLTSGEKVQAMAMAEKGNGMIFCLVDCLHDAYQMKTETINLPSYIGSKLISRLNREILPLFPKKIRSRMIPFYVYDGAFLRLPTEKEIFGVNEYGADEGDSVKQWEPMKTRKNRLASLGKDGLWEWYWLCNKKKYSPIQFAPTQFVICDSYGQVSHAAANNFLGVRPVFMLRN